MDGHGALLPTPAQRAWISRELASLRADRGEATFLRGPLHFPDDRSFPDRWEASEDGVRRLTDRVLGLAGLDAHAEVVGFTHERDHELDERGRSRATRHEGAAAILMRATPLRHIAAVADARESMPPKSTFFHPKIPSGLLIHPLEG